LLKATDRFDNSHQRIGILGGVFDPIHNGHLALAKAALERFSLERLILIPSSTPPPAGKHKQTTPGFLRLDMVKAAIRNEPQLEASDIELKRQGISYTVDTLRELRQRYFQPTSLYFFIGSDWMDHLNEWKDFKTILSLCTLIMANRPGYQKTFKTPSSVQMFDFDGLNIASSDIREQAHAGKSIRAWVPGAVADIIEKQNLYRSSL